MFAKKMKGVSLGQFLLVLVIAMMAGLFLMKVGPMYMEYKSVKSAMDDLAGGQYDSVGDVRTSLIKRLDMNYVESVKKEDIAVRQKNGAYEVSVEYYVDKPLFGNLTISGYFEYSVNTSN